MGAIVPRAKGSPTYPTCLPIGCLVRSPVLSGREPKCVACRALSGLISAGPGRYRGHAWAPRGSNAELKRCPGARSQSRWPCSRLCTIQLLMADSTLLVPSATALHELPSPSQALSESRANNLLLFHPPPFLDEALLVPRSRRCASCDIVCTLLNRTYVS
jgi:hypothetical protein